MKRATGDIIILHMCTKKLWSHDVQFLRYDVQQKDRRTDRKSEILRWVPQKEMESFYEIKISRSFDNYYRNVIRTLTNIYNVEFCKKVNNKQAKGTLSGLRQFLATETL